MALFLWGIIEVNKLYKFGAKMLLKLVFLIKTNKKIKLQYTGAGNFLRSFR